MDHILNVSITGNCNISSFRYSAFRKYSDSLCHGCDVGWAFYFFFLGFFISMFWPGMVLNQGQLSIVISDWESYLGSPFPPSGRQGSLVVRALD